MARGQHPNSLKNLENPIRTGRTKKYGDRKERKVLVSQQGWEGSLSAAKEAGCSGISELLERLGRGEIVLEPAVVTLSGTKRPELEITGAVEQPEIVGPL